MFHVQSLFCFHLYLYTWFGTFSLRSRIVQPLLHSFLFFVGYIIQKRMTLHIFSFSRALYNLRYLLQFLLCQKMWSKKVLLKMIFLQVKFCKKMSKIYVKIVVATHNLKENHNFHMQYIHIDMYTGVKIIRFLLVWIHVLKSRNISIGRNFFYSISCGYCSKFLWLFSHKFVNS